MTLLAALSTLLNDETSLQVQISRKGGDLQVITLPKMAGFQPDTKDVELAAIQAALAQPLVFTLAAATAPDAEFDRLLAEAAQIRQPAVDQLMAYREAQRQSQQAARAAQEKKSAAPPKGKTGASKVQTTAPDPASPSGDVPEQDAGDGIALEALGAPAGAPTVEAAAPADAVAVDLF